MQISHAPPAAAETLHFLCCKNLSVKGPKFQELTPLTDIKTEHTKLAAAATYTQIKLSPKSQYIIHQKITQHLHVVPCGHDDDKRLITQLLRQRGEQLATRSGDNLPDL